MADVGNTIIGTGVNMGVGRGLSALGARIPVPLPSFYNPNDPDHFQNSQFMQMARGDGHARRNYILRAGGKILGGILGAGAGPLGSMAGSAIGSNLAGRFENWLEHRDNGPRGTVNVGQINTDGSGAPVASINQETGEVSYMPNFNDGSTGMQYGPTANQYAGLPAAPSTNFVMPDFSEYGNTGGGGGGRENYVETQAGDNGFGGGSMGGWNGASHNMMTDFAATTNGAWEQHEGVQRRVKTMRKST